MAFETRFCSNCARPLEWITLAEDSGDVARLRCPACGFTHWGNPTPVLAVAGLQTQTESYVKYRARGATPLQAQVGSAMETGIEVITELPAMKFLTDALGRKGASEFVAGLLARDIPLAADHKRELFGKFATVIRATVKGNILVAMSQGALGGLIFAFLGIPGAVLWGVVMAVLSLLPAVGASLVWGPVALYFFSTGAIWQGAVLTAFGVLVIGLVDNILRPILVGKDTKMPDYLVLLSTLGGLAVFGLNGFVIGPVIAAMFMAVWGIVSPSASDTPAPPA